MVLDSEIYKLLNEYEKLVDSKSICEEPELYDSKHLELIYAAKKGDAKSLRSIAITLLKGDGVPVSFDNAREIFYRLSSENSDDKISKYYYFKCLCLEGLHSEGIEGMSGLILLDFAPAITFKGNLFEFGQCGLNTNVPAARVKYEKSTDMNHVSGAFLLSKLLFKERGVASKLNALSNYLNAIHLSAKAAKDPNMSECLTF